MRELAWLAFSTAAAHAAAAFDSLRFAHARARPLEPAAQTSAPAREKSEPCRPSERALAACRENPGRWARVASARNASDAIKFRKVGLEATYRKLEDGRAYIWARWPDLSE